MNKTKLIISLSVIPLVLLSSCSSKNFTNWKKEGSIKAIKEFIDDVCDKNSKNYVPVEYRISTWDIDGTGILERNLGNHDLLPQDQIIEYTYKHYRSGETEIKEAYEDYIEYRENYWNNETDKTATALYRITQAAFLDAAIGGLTPTQANEYFDEAVKNGYYTTEKKLLDIAYKPMVEMYKYLLDHDFQVYFISGTFRYALYAIASNLFGDIDFQHCIGTDYAVEYVKENNAYVTKFTTVQDICINSVKVNKIVTEIGKAPVIAFGNSTGDSDMLRYTIDNPKYKSMAVVINHDDSDREYVYNYDKVHAMCEELGALEVSMKNDFLTIY